MSFLTDLVKKPLLEQVEASRKALPATLVNLSTQAVAFLPTTVEKATAVFRTTYTGLVTRLTGWIPTTIPALTRLGNRLADWAVVKIKAIK